MTARVFVRAVVVTDGRSRHLRAVLDAVSAQGFSPDALVIATVGDASIALPAGLEAQVMPVAAQASYSEAVEAVLAASPAHDAEYLWLLHDDSAPLPDVLSRLVATARKRSRAAIIGAAQVRWSNTSRLISLGSTVSRVGARRVDLVEDNDINQGQYDFRDDVLAVSMAGALVRRDVWTQLGGLDDAYRGFGESADFCRRTWRAGYDVVVVPGAFIRHVQANLRGARDHDTAARGTYRSYSLRRTGEWYHATVWNPLLTVPLLVVWAFASSIVRALLRVAQNDARRALTDLAVPWRLLGRMSQLGRSRLKARRHATVRAADMRELLASPGTVVNYVRGRYLRSYDRWRMAVTPSGMIRAELAAVAQRRRWMLALVVVLSAGVSTAIFGGWLPGLLAGRMLVGSALGVTDVGWHDLWQRSWSGWSDVGYGAPSLDGGFSAALIPFAILPGGLRLWLGLALTFAVVLAAVSAWLAAGAASRAVSVRAVAALAYAAWPPFLVAIAQGRVGAVLAHIALPLVALGVTRAFGWHRGEALARGDEYTARRIASPSAAAAASLALAFCVAAAPVLLLPSLAALALVAVIAGRRWLRAALIAVPALAISAPGIQAAFQARSVRDAFGILSRDAGPSAVSDVASPLRTLLTLDTAPGGSQWYSSTFVVAAIALMVCAVALLALLSGRASRAVRVGLVMASLGLVVTFAAQRTVVAWPDGAGAAAANGFSGPGLSFALLGALAAAAAASQGAWHSGGAIRVRRVAAVVVVTAAACAVLVSATAWAWPGRPAAGDVRTTGVNVLPLVAALEQQPPSSERVLTLTDTDTGVAYSVENSDGAVVVTGGAGFGSDGAALARPGQTSVPSPADLSKAVATLVGAGVGADDQLATWGIGVIVATPHSPKALAGLAQVDTLQLLGASELGTVYRVMRGDQGVSRAWIEAAHTTIPVATSFSVSTATLAASDSGTLVLAVPADHAWRATLAGVPLASVPDANGRQAFTVPEGGGDLDVRFDDGRYRFWWWLAAVACGLALVASAPIHERRIIGGRA